MTKLSPEQHAALTVLAQKLDAAKHGEHVDLVKAAAAGLGREWQTVHSWLKAGNYRYSTRKTRSDAGKHALTYDEGLKIVDRMQGGMTLGNAIKACRSEGLIKAVRIKKNGETIPLSNSAITRALRDFGLYKSRKPGAQMSDFRSRLEEEQRRIGINQAKSGAHRIDAAYLAKIAAKGADVHYILTGQHSVALKPDEMALLDNYNHCDESDKRNLERTASALAKQKVKGKAA
ncbi:MAG: hypothetical protein LBQ81_09670 [Zoogloeaceae bacterium]|jgi:hypothetical protein|nr:hypothetical protein [Zoogloeaceae bacterium]